MVTGYVGSDTMPKCTRGYCWYLIEKNYTLSQDQLTKLYVDSVPANARHVVDNGVTIIKFEAKGLFIEWEGNWWNLHKIDNHFIH